MPEIHNTPPTGGDGGIRLFGLIGYPLTHSFSGKYFTEKFEKEQISGAATNYSRSKRLMNYQFYFGIIRNWKG